MAEKIYNLTIIGSGPAGYTAAIYAARADLKPLLFTGLNSGGAPGGQLMLTSEIENFPGFPEGIQGPELMDKMRAQAVRFGTELITEDVAAVDFSVRPFRLTAGGKEYQSRSVIIATGASAKWLGLDSEKKLQGRGVSACATCDGAFFRDKKVVVVGGGDSAMEEALFLTKFATEILVLVRGSQQEIKASKIMLERATKHKKISFTFNTEVIEIHDPALGKVTAVTAKNADGSTQTIKTDGVFVAIGHKPNTTIFAGQVALDKLGYLKLHDGAKTSVQGVFAAGDVHDISYRQAVTAAGFGCRAALEAEQYLVEHEGVQTVGGSGWF